jgi:hypothetical protein
MTKEARMYRFARTTLVSIAVYLGLVAGAADASSGRATNGHFPIDEHFVVEPDSMICGFPMTLDITGQATFNARFDADGNLTTVHVHGRAVGTFSANGIELRDFSSDNKFFDFQNLTMRETGLVFRDNLLGGKMVLMDRGRLIWNLDPATGQTVGDPLFEAGPHPELHGDIAALCAALTP